MPELKSTIYFRIERAQDAMRNLETQNLNEVLMLEQISVILAAQEA